MKKFGICSKTLLVALSILIMGGCSSDDSSGFTAGGDSGIHFDISGVDYSAVSAPDINDSVVPAGAAQLAAQCAQCHGTYGIAVADWPSLWGGSRGINDAMKDYQDPIEYGDSSMHLHALAYTEEEVLLLKEYYNKVNYTAEGGE